MENPLSFESVDDAATAMAVFDTLTLAQQQELKKSILGQALIDAAKQVDKKYDTKADDQDKSVVN
jgi:hypothetical protein